MDLGLDGRAALVTGGSKGIRLAITERLLREGLEIDRAVYEALGRLGA